MRQRRRSVRSAGVSEVPAEEDEHRGSGRVVVEGERLHRPFGLPLGRGWADQRRDPRRMDA
jgi:hypothetical protein